MIRNLDVSQNSLECKLIGINSLQPFKEFKRTPCLRLYWPERSSIVKRNHGRARGTTRGLKARGMSHSDGFGVEWETAQGAAHGPSLVSFYGRVSLSFRG